MGYENHGSFRLEEKEKNKLSNYQTRIRDMIFLTETWSSREQGAGYSGIEGATSWKMLSA
ncbi:hypothetical protein PAAG_11049 [Paracoccidioides lutzii Pb01]|uniref:Uncharacterized protein n=1 Tax=Paracoccidioides lutzii (strain ATCC MYA-826 / Pb01) TaxID=502779 RepID=A0A0A2V7P3_PARBA|nr:hypothetical protein PAAG_11049 [Paracoccidioides lutzii Pb01]KGQ02100.1 hypothetical protein PAAG_11049 [Paracoccidioides lutzii Pb01]